MGFELQLLENETVAKNGNDAELPLKHDFVDQTTGLKITTREASVAAAEGKPTSFKRRFRKVRTDHLTVSSACRGMTARSGGGRRAFPVKLIGNEGNRCAAYRWLFARRLPKRALSNRRRAVRERVTNRLAPIATLALPSHKG
jgi:hypothetical protein